MVRRWLSPRYAHTTGASYSSLARENFEMEHPSTDAAPVSLMRMRGTETVRVEGVEGAMVRWQRWSDPPPAWKSGHEREVMENVRYSTPKYGFDVPAAFTCTENSALADVIEVTN